MSSPSSPCAACKMLRRKCTQGCVFAPYFPPDDPAKFARVHQVFGASNVSKILNNVPQPLRGDAANSLAYEADARIRDPVYGCVAYILILECKVEEIRADIVAARKELAVYIGPAAFGPLAAAPRYHHPAAAQYAGVHPHHLDQQMMRHRQQKMAEARRRAATVDVVTVQGVMMGQATFYAHAEQGSSLVGPMVAAVPHDAGAPYDGGFVLQPQPASQARTAVALPLTYQMESPPPSSSGNSPPEVVLRQQHTDGSDEGSGGDA